MQYKNSLPLPVLVIGGAVLGFVGAMLLLALAKSLALIVGPLLGAIWGLSLYKRPVR